MKNFNTVEQLREDPKLKTMSRYQWEKVLLDGKEVYACTTNQQYEDILYGGFEQVVKELFEHFQIQDAYPGDYATILREYLLRELEKDGYTFVDVYEEY